MTTSVKSPGFELVKGVRAVPPTVAKFKGMVLAETFSQEPGARPFCDAGWRFVEGCEASEKCLPVVRDQKGQIKIVAPSMNVKFRPGTSQKYVSELLTSEGLEVRRKVGFAPNSYLVTGEDVLGKANRLSANGAIEWATPTTIEELGGRG